MSTRPVLLAVLAVAGVGLLTFALRWDGSPGGESLALSPTLGGPAVGRDPGPGELAGAAPAAAGNATGATQRTDASLETTEAGDEPTEPLEPWRLRVWTKTYEGRGRPGVPRGDLGVRVGTGFPDPAAEILAEGRTGADGACDLELSPEAVAALEGARPVAWVVEDGWQFRPRRFELTETPPAEPIDVNLVAAEGRALRGRLFDPAGEPTRGRIQLYESREGRLRSRENTMAGEDGWFALDYGREGRFHLGAESDLGTAAARDVVIDVRQDPEPVELHLVGPGRLRGVVRDGTGEPAPGLSLLFRVAELDDGPGGGWNLVEPRASDLRLEGRGRLQTYATTDESGGFDVAGLLLADWTIRTRAAGSRAYDVVLTPGPVPADGEPLELSLRRPHLRVRLVGPEEDTEQDTEPREDFATSSSPFSRRRQTWPSKPRLVVQAAAQAARLDGSPRSLPARLVRAGEYVVEVEEEETYVVGAYGGAHPWVERVVHVPPGAGRIEVELPLPAASEPGGLLISVVDSGGEPRTRDISLQLYDAAAEVPVVRYDEFRGVEWPMRIELPAARYRLVVRDEGNGRRWGSGGRRTSGLFDTLVDVLPATDVPVVAALPDGARIQLQLTGEANEADLAGAKERLGERGARWAEAVARSVRVVLVDDDGEVAQEVAFEREGGRIDSRVPFGYEGTSNVVFAGRFVLEVRTEGGRVASTPVTLVDGETVEVALSFDE